MIKLQDAVMVANRTAVICEKAISPSIQLLIEYMEKHSAHAGGPNICQCSTCIKAREQGYIV